MSKAAATLAEAVLQKREKLKAYHGSPHDFDQFSAENIGTGEGAQAYGHGLYFAENEAVAKDYRDRLTPRDPDYEEWLMGKYKDAEAAQDYSRMEMYERGLMHDTPQDFRDIASDADYDDDYRQLASEVADEIDEYGPDLGKMYEVEIDASPDELLDFDLPLNKQSAEIQQALAPIIEKANKMLAPSEQIVSSEATGGRLYNAYLEYRGRNSDVAAEALNDIGIKGIKYKDQFSRVGSGETNNYVIFDDRLIEISKQYGVSIPVAGAILSGTMTTSEARAQDDITGEFLEERQNADVSYGEQLFAQAQKLNQERPEASLLEKAGEAAEVVGDVVSDVARGISETPQQIIGGLLDAVQEAAYTMESMIPVGGIAIGDDIDKYWGIPGFIDMTVDERYQALSELPKKVSQADSTTGDIVRDIAAFTSMFLPANRAATAAGAVKSAPFIAGFIADAAAFNAFEGRLSNLIQEYDGLANPVTEFLASSEDDSLLMAKFKAALEGLGLGAAAEGFVKSVTVYKKAKEVKRIAQQNNQTAEDLITDVAAENPQLSIDMGIEEGEFIPLEQLADKAGAVIKIPQVKGGEQALDDVKNINLNNLETTDDVKNLIDKVAEASPVETDLARRGKINNQTTEALANDLGMSVEDLLTRRAGVAFNAEEAVAARNILVASGENLVTLGQKASDPLRGTEADLLIFRRAMAQHQAIQLQVSGLTAEAGRALQSFRIAAKSQQEQLKAINEMLSTAGGAERSKQMAGMVATLETPQQINDFAKKASKATTPEMLYEVWINSLLSSPATHVVNAVSNTLVPILSMSERKVASWLSGGVKDQEAAMMAKGAVEGAKDGFRLAWQAFKSGEPSDVMDKVEVDERKALSSKNLNAVGTAGRAADFLGTAFRMPGRLLTTSDEFFKAVGYRMELNAQAYRTAVNEGLEGDALAKRIADLIHYPPPNIHLEAVDFKRYQTFTNELGEVGKGIEKVRNKSMFLRAIMPFIRTPVNIMSFTVERTPLGFAFEKVRDDVRAGGARRDLALGKVAVGSMIMASAADLALQGEITGGGPSNYDMQKIMKMNGWQPYSMKVNGVYYSYSRLDPVGSFLGLAADVVEITGQLSEFDAINLASASVLSIVQNLASKTYLRGVSEFFDAVLTSSTDAEGNNYKLNRYFERNLTTLIPYSSLVAAAERQLNPRLDETYTFMDRLKSRVPGYGKEGWGLYPSRNIFGDVMVLEGGLGPDFASPVYTSTEKFDPVITALVDNKIPISDPQHKLGGVELTPEQYDRYVLLQAGEGQPITLRQNLKMLIDSPVWKQSESGPDGRRSNEVRRIVAKWRQIGQNQLKAEFPELRDAIEIERQRSQR